MNDIERVSAQGNRSGGPVPCGRRTRYGHERRAALVGVWIGKLELVSGCGRGHRLLPGNGTESWKKSVLLIKAVIDKKNENTPTCTLPHAADVVLVCQEVSAGEVEALNGSADPGEILQATGGSPDSKQTSKQKSTVRFV